MNINLNTVVDHCMVAALWSTGNYETGEPLDDQYTTDDLAPDAAEKIVNLCSEFILKAGDLLENYPMGDEQLGHDIWLTVNGHGAGFWDRAELKHAHLGEALTAIADTLPEVDLHVGYDDMIHAE